MDTSYIWNSKKNELINIIKDQQVIATNDANSLVLEAHPINDRQDNRLSFWVIILWNSDDPANL